MLERIYSIIILLNSLANSFRYTKTLKHILSNEEDPFEEMLLVYDDILRGLF
jgi:hypothetical protein